MTHQVPSWRDELPPPELPPSGKDQPRMYAVSLYEDRRDLTSGRQLVTILDLAPGPWMEEADRRLHALTRRLLAGLGITDPDRIDRVHLVLSDVDPPRRVVMEWVPTRWVGGEEPRR